MTAECKQVPLHCNCKKKMSGQHFVGPTNSDFLAKPIPSLTLNTADICNSLFTTNGTEHFASLGPCKNALCLIKQELSALFSLEYVLNV